MWKNRERIQNSGAVGTFKKKKNTKVQPIHNSELMLFIGSIQYIHQDCIYLTKYSKNSNPVQYFLQFKAV